MFSAPKNKHKNISINENMPNDLEENSYIVSNNVETN